MRAGRGILAGLIGVASLGMALYGMHGAPEQRAIGEALLKAAVGKGGLRLALYFGRRGRKGAERYFLDSAERLLTEAVRVGRGVSEWAALLFAARVLQGRIGAAKEALRSTVIFLPPDDGLRQVQQAVEMGNPQGVQIVGHRLPLDEWERLLVVAAATKACGKGEWAKVAETNLDQAAELVGRRAVGILALAGAVLAFLLFGVGAYVHPALRRKLGKGEREAALCGPFEGFELLGWWLGFMLIFQNAAFAVANLAGAARGSVSIGLTASMLLVAQGLIALAVVGVIYLQTLLKGKPSLKGALLEAGLDAQVRPRRGLLAYSLILPAYAVSAGITYIALKGRAVSWNPLMQLVIMAEGARDLTLLLVYLCVAVPFVEELVFRGWLFGGLRARFSFWPAALISSAAFALIHLDFPLLLPLFAIGCALAFSREVTGSLWATIVAHGIHNAVTVAALRLLVG